MTAGLAAAWLGRHRFARSTPSLAPLRWLGGVASFLETGKLSGFTGLFSGTAITGDDPILASRPYLNPVVGGGAYRRELRLLIAGISCHLGAFEGWLASKSHLPLAMLAASVRRCLYGLRVGLSSVRFRVCHAGARKAREADGQNRG